MQVTEGLESFVPPPGGVVLSIGNFDGVHRGHASILATVRDVAARLGTPPLAITFDPHPLAVLAPERAPPPLTTTSERLALLARCGLDRCLVLRATPELLAQTAEDFLARLVAHTRPRAIVEGPDFNFGRGRGGSIATLTRHAPRWGYEVHVVPAVHCAELPTHPVISSSSIRQAVREGRIGEARAMLGRPYRVVGRVGHGHHRGTGLGFPTANLEDTPHLLPQPAVYAAVAQVDDVPLPAMTGMTGRATPALLLAAVNVGPQPTFAQPGLRVEAHLLDYHDPSAGHDLRGRRLGLHFLARVREQVQFAGPGELVAQIERDLRVVRGLADEVARLAQSGVIPL